MASSCSAVGGALGYLGYGVTSTVAGVGRGVTSTVAGVGHGVRGTVAGVGRGVGELASTATAWSVDTSLAISHALLQGGRRDMLREHERGDDPSVPSGDVSLPCVLKLGWAEGPGARAFFWTGRCSNPPSASGRGARGRVPWMQCRRSHRGWIRLWPAPTSLPPLRHVKIPWPRLRSYPGAQHWPNTPRPCAC